MKSKQVKFNYAKVLGFIFIDQPVYAGELRVGSSIHWGDIHAILGFMSRAKYLNKLLLKQFYDMDEKCPVK